MHTPTIQTGTQQRKEWPSVTHAQLEPTVSSGVVARNVSSVLRELSLRMVHQHALLVREAVLRHIMRRPSVRYACPVIIRMDSRRVALCVWSVILVRPSCFYPPHISPLTTMYNFTTKQVHIHHQTSQSNAKNVQADVSHQRTDRRYVRHAPWEQYLTKMLKARNVSCFRRVSSETVSNVRSIRTQMRVRLSVPHVLTENTPTLQLQDVSSVTLCTIFPHTAKFLTLERYWLWVHSSSLSWFLYSFEDTKRNRIESKKSWDSICIVRSSSSRQSKPTSSSWQVWYLFLHNNPITNLKLHNNRCMEIIPSRSNIRRENCKRCVRRGLERSTSRSLGRCDQETVSLTFEEFIGLKRSVRLKKKSESRENSQTRRIYTWALQG